MYLFLRTHLKNRDFISKSIHSRVKQINPPGLAKLSFHPVNRLNDFHNKTTVLAFHIVILRMQFKKLCDSNS